MARAEYRRKLLQHKELDSRLRTREYLQGFTLGFLFFFFGFLDCSIARLEQTPFLLSLECTDVLGLGG